MDEPIPLSQPDITERDVESVVDTLQSGMLTLGPKLEEFESLCARVTGRRHGVGLSSGTAGLHCAMIAAGVGEGDEVITTPFSFVASANAALFVGAKPVFVDIDPQTLNLDPAKVEAAITPKTKAILAVETFGHPGGMLELEQIARRHEIPLIEDGCEAFGGKYGERPIGSFGRASVFSFFPNKQVTTGEGGMLVTDDAALADACRSLRNQGRDGHGWLSHDRLGFNYRLSEIHAALGVSQMQGLEENLAERRRVAAAYIRRLMDNRYLILPTIGNETHVSWFVFVVRLNDLFAPGDRDTILRELRGEGIGCCNYFPPIHLQPYMRERFGYEPGLFPVTEYVAARTVALPFFTRMTEAHVDRVCSTLCSILDKTMTNPRARF